ncbi:MAG: PAS domain-containing protein [Desulfuromonadales bacterium]
MIKSQRNAEMLVTGMLDPVFQVAGVGLAVLDLEGCFLRVNTALEGLLDISEPDLLGSPVFHYCTPSDANSCFDMIQELSMTEEGVQCQELSLNTAKDEPLWVHVTASLLDDDETLPACIVLTIHDSSDYFELLEDM